MTREFSPAARKEFEELLARYPERGAATLPALRLLEREFGAVDEEGLKMVAGLLGLPPARLYGVATFYSHLRGPSDGKYVLEVCRTLPCALRGAGKIYELLREKTAGDPLFTVRKVECLANCGRGPCLQANGEDVGEVTPAMIDAMIGEMRAGRWTPPRTPNLVPPCPYPPVLLRHVGEPGSHTLEHYRRRGGYETLQAVRREGKAPEEIVETVFASGLRGRGGAGFSTGQKWKFLPKNDKPRYLVVNADESEPGTFKDRILIEQDPHAILEGAALAAYAIRARAVYIYIRGEFVRGAEILRGAIREAEEAGLLGPVPFTVHRGAGAYICGEETGLLSSLEGKRGCPKIRPPFPAVEGLFRCPTIINNVETISLVTPIVKNGPAWFRSMGTERSPGPKIFSVCGHAARPGWYEVPLGIPARELIFDLAGGVAGGRKLKAVIPGGLSTPVLTAEEILSDPPLRLDFESLAAAGTMLGSGGMILLDDTVCMVEALWNVLRFYHHESCGQCTPCREGTGWLEKLAGRLERGGGAPSDVGLLDEVAANMLGRTICVLADAAAMPVRSYVRKFRAEFEAHAAGKGCSARHGAVPEPAAGKG